MKIRKLTASDALIFQEIRLQAVKEAPEAFGGTFEEERENSLSMYEDRLDSGAENLILAVFDDSNDVRGMLGLFRHHKIKRKHQVHLWGTYVDSGFRGKGAAQLLIQQSIDCAKLMEGVEQIRIGVVTKNISAKKLYESFGFKTYGVEPKAFKLGNKYYDIEHMMFFL